MRRRFYFPMLVGLKPSAKRPGKLGRRARSSRDKATSVRHAAEHLFLGEIERRASRAVMPKATAGPGTPRAY